MTGVHSKRGGKKYFICYFLDTGFEKLSSGSNILRGFLKDDSLIYFKEYKICTICKTNKEFSLKNFDRNRNICKECRKNKKIKRMNNKKENNPVDYYSAMMARWARSRIFSPSKKKKCYRGLEKPFGFESSGDLAKYIKDNFSEDILKILANDKTPSLDRINSSIGYTKDNIQVISFIENTLDGVETRKKKVYLMMKSGKEIIFESLTNCAIFFGKKGNSTSCIKSWILDDGLYKKPDKILKIEYL